MSKNSIEKITCPQCGKEAEFTVWQSVNTDLDPEMRAAVKDLSIFRFTCPKCGYSALADYDFLYHDMRNKVMIQYAASDEEAEQAKAIFSGDGLPKELRGLFGGMLYDGYILRIVRSQNELREKLEILDAGLDDRLIELYKTVLLPKAFEKFPRAKKLDMYFLQMDGKNMIQILTDGNGSATVDIDPDLYEILRKEFEPLLPDIRKDEPVIDRDYAFRAAVRRRQAAGS